MAITKSALLLSELLNVSGGGGGAGVTNFNALTNVPFKVFDGDATGATDVGAAINTWAAANAGAVVLPKGTFLVTTPIDPSVTSNNLFLIGQGVGRTTIKYGYNVQDDAGNSCAAIAYNGKYGSSNYAATSALIGNGQTAVTPITLTVTGISSSATLPTVTTSVAHNLGSGVDIWLTGVVSSSSATTITVASSGSSGITLTATAHTYLLGQVISLQSFAGGTWSTLTDVYKIYNVTANTFQISTLDGAPITTALGVFSSGTTQLGVGGMYKTILDSGTTTTTFRLYDIRGNVINTTGITWSSGGTVTCYFNRYLSFQVASANGDFLFACDVADASLYSIGDQVNIHSQDDFLSGTGEGRYTGEPNSIAFADLNANRLYFQKPIAFSHIYHTSVLVTRYKGTQKVFIQGISFTNDAATGDPLDTPYAVTASGNVSSAIDIFGVVRPVIRDCNFSSCWGTAVRFINCINFSHLNNDTDNLYSADVYDNVTEKIINSVTAATPPVVTTTATHSFANGSPIVIKGVVGPSGTINDKVFMAMNVNSGAKTFELYDLNGRAINGSAWSAYVSGGTCSIGNVRRLGYGVSAYGASSGVVDGGSYRNGRHPFTTDGKSGITYAANKWFFMGQPTNVLVKNIVCIDSWGPSLDSHEEGRWIEFANCEVSHGTRSPDATDTYSTGLLAQTRCLDTTFRNCIFTGGRQQVRLANTDHTIVAETRFYDCQFVDSTPLSETQSGNKEGAIIIDTSESTKAKYWPQVKAFNCVFDNVGVAVYLTESSSIPINSQARLYNCSILRASFAAYCGSGTRFEMHGGVIDYTGIGQLAMRRRANAYCVRLRDDATIGASGAGSTGILNNVTIIRGTTTNHPTAIFERATSNGITKTYFSRNCTIVNPNALAAISVLSAKTDMVEATFITDNTDTRNINTTAVGNVGVGEDNLITHSLLANTLYASGRAVKITAWGTSANNANAKTVKIHFGSQLMGTLALTISQVNTWKAVATVVSTGDDTQDYEAQIMQAGVVSQFTLGNGTAIIDDGSTIVIKCTGEGVSNNDILMEGLVVELI